jgi:hypothetical protein
LSGGGKTAVVLQPSPGQAFSIVPEVATFEGLLGDLTGEVHFVGSTNGTPEGGVSLVGAPGATDVSFMFRIVVDGSSQSLEDVTFAPDVGSTSAAGWIPGASEPDGLVDLGSASIALGIATLTFSSYVLPGQTTNDFFVSFPEELFVSGGASWLALHFYQPDDPFASANAFLTVVPEPSSGALVLLGLGALLKIYGRRRR